ncbi:hypothetical protein KAI92_02860 [Candidatus Parcubacteria bacterium]|nr:hypothetical protein [Candidatus Parcubacteria bacterium]
MQNQTQDSNQNPNLEQNQIEKQSFGKKPFLSGVTKILLAVLLFTVLIVIVISSWYFINVQHKNVTNNQVTKPINQEIENCAKIGESIGTCVGCIEKCCQGLKAMADVKYNKYNGECANLPAPRKGGICSNCGNGICDNKNNEDECNCPEDCGEIKIPDQAIYKSKKLGIMFKYPAWWKDLPKDTIIEKNNTIKSTVEGGTMIVFEKSKNETIEDAIKRIIGREGSNLSDCKILVSKQDVQKENSDIIVSILLQKDYEPSDNEIIAKISNVDSLKDLDVICKTTPECTWAKQILTEEKTKTKCSQYAKCFGYKCISSFIYQPDNSREKFIYLQSMAATPHFWEWNSIEILKDESGTSNLLSSTSVTNNWQTYQNEKLEFKIQYPKYYFEDKYDLENMTDLDYKRIHFFRDMSDDTLNDFKKHYITSLCEDGTHSGTINIKSYSENELKNWYKIDSFDNLKLKKYGNFKVYILEIGDVELYYIIPHDNIDNLYFTFNIPAFLQNDFENKWLNTFKFTN